MAESSHRFNFVRVGGIDQVVIANAEDLAHLSELDPKLWATLAMPTRGVELDPKTLDLVDADKDGRIRVPEVLAAVKWVLEVHKSPDLLFKGGESLSLSSIKDAGVLSGARRILENLGKPNASEISLADITDTAKIFNATSFNGDGVVPADTVTDPALRKAIEDIGATVGTVADRSGKQGVDKAKVEAFYKDARAFTAWAAKGKASAGVLPAGEATSAAFAAISAVEAKVDDFFTRCRLAAFDPRGAAALDAAELDPAKLAGKSLSPASEELSRLPVAKAEPGRALPFDEGVNPAWRSALATLSEKAVAPLLGAGKSALTEKDWADLKAKLAGHRAWVAEKPTTAVEKLGTERLEALLAADLEKGLSDVLAKDAALEPEFAQIAAVEKLLRFQRDLVTLLRNFVNFADFFGRKGAVFQAGTLYLDGRACDLCVEVTDPGKHGTLATMAATYLAYCDLVRPSGEKKTIVAAFTDGDSDNLFVGRNGVFFDRKGKDWDATIARAVANPISIREAFWSPYKKFIRMVEEQVAKRASAGEADATAKLAGAAETVGQTKKPEPKKMDIGTVAAIGVAVGGIGAMVTAIFGAFLGLGLWMPVGILGVILLISGPSMVLAWLKLRQRNLGPILDANGWAINGRARINVPFGAALTHVAALPKGAARSLEDPYAEKKSPWKLYLVLLAFVAIAALWYLGRFDGLLPTAAKSTTVLGDQAPAAVQAPAPAVAPAAPAAAAPAPAK